MISRSKALNTQNVAMEDKLNGRLVRHINPYIGVFKLFQLAHMPKVFPKVFPKVGYWKHLHRHHATHRRISKSPLFRPKPNAPW